MTDRATYAYLGDVYVESPTAVAGSASSWSPVWSPILSSRDCAAGHLRRQIHTTYMPNGFGPPANPDIHLFIERAPADLWPPQTEQEGSLLRQTTQDSRVDVPGSPASPTAIDLEERQNPRLAGVLFVELGGLEPPTSWVRSRRSPN